MSYCHFLPAQPKNKIKQTAKEIAMSLQENNKFDCDKLKKFSDIFVQMQTAKPNQVSLQVFIEELFSEYFQPLFTYYDEKLICKNRTNCRNSAASSIPPTDDDLWIFGYGSLVWKADFPFIDKKQGYIEGYQRRFFQHSIDHRGTPERPGRVVTLIPSNEDQSKVYGVAYRIAKDQKEEVLAHLDYREKNGYQRKTLEFIEFGTGAKINVIMYIATNDNDSFAGGSEDDLQPIANQIYTTAGPSGPNREYLYNLADAMKESFPGVIDQHLFKLEELVKRREQRDVMLANVIKSNIRSVLQIQNAEIALKTFRNLWLDSKQEDYLENLNCKLQCDS